MNNPRYAPSYQFRHTPPSWWEYAFSSPFSFLLSVFSIPVAVMVLVDPLAPQYLFSKSLGEVPLSTGVALGVSMFLGAVLATAGLVTTTDNRTLAGNVEKAGWWLLASAWTGYSLVVLLAFPGSVISWGMALQTGLICLIRVVQITAYQSRILYLRKASTGGMTAVSEAGPWETK